MTTFELSWNDIAVGHGITTRKSNKAVKLGKQAMQDAHNSFYLKKQHYQQKWLNSWIKIFSVFGISLNNLSTWISEKLR